MNKRVLFYANIEIDYLVLERIASNFHRECECILLIPNTTRALKLVEESAWSMVIVLSEADLPSHFFGILRGMRDSVSVKRELKSKLGNISFDYAITFDAFKFRDVILFDYLKSKGVKHLVISMFVGNRFFSDLRRLRWQQSIVYQTYLWIIGSFSLSYTEYKLQSSDVKGIRLLSGYKPNYTLSIMDSRQLLKPISGDLGSFAFPIKIAPYKDRGKGRILFLVSTLQSERQDDYWERVSLILDELGGFEVILKDHPQAARAIPQHVLNKAHSFIDNNRNIEEFVINTNNVHRVIGSGSTALITLSWMGCITSDISSLLGIDEKRTQYYHEYMEHGEVEIIRSISKFSEIINDIPDRRNTAMEKEKNLNTLYDELFEQAKK